MLDEVDLQYYGHKSNHDERTFSHSCTLLQIDLVSLINN